MSTFAGHTKSTPASAIIHLPRVANEIWCFVVASRTVSIDGRDKAETKNQFVSTMCP